MADKQNDQKYAEEHGIKNKGSNTADVNRSVGGAHTFINASKHLRGDTRGDWEDKLDGL